MASISTTLKTLTLAPGECAVLPAGATVVSITADGSITATSSCGTLPEPGAYKCWRFRWEQTTDDAAHDDARFTGIQIGNTIYSLENTGVSQSPGLSVDGSLFLRYALSVATPPGLIRSGSISYTHNPTGSDCILMEIPESLGRPILFWSNPGFENGAFYADDDNCSCS